jgi:hypothetical protein
VEISTYLDRLYFKLDASVRWGEVANWRRLTLFFADDILDCVVEAFGEIVDPLALFHQIAKRAVDLLAISIARYRLRRP